MKKTGQEEDNSAEASVTKGAESDGIKGKGNIQGEHTNRRRKPDRRKGKQSVTGKVNGIIAWARMESLANSQRITAEIESDTKGKEGTKYDSIRKDGENRKGFVT